MGCLPLPAPRTVASRPHVRTAALFRPGKTGRNDAVQQKAVLSLRPQSHRPLDGAV